MSHTTKKAQTIMSDFSIGLAIFLVTVFVAFNIYGDMKETKSLKYDISDINLEINSISNKLIRSKGYPENWNKNNVLDIGWEQDYPLLNTTKLNYTTQLTYSQLKDLLKTNYDFQINITYKNGSIYKINQTPLSYGTSLNITSSILSHVSRIAYIESDNKRIPVSINVYMWKNRIL